MSKPDIVDVQITIKDVSPTRPSFGIPLLIGYHTRWIGAFYKLYGSTDEMLDDGFTTDDYLYKAAVTLTSQEQAPKQFMIGRRAAALTSTFTAAPAITTEGKVLTWSIEGHDGSYTIPNGASVQSIVEAVQPTIDAYSEVAASEDDTKLTITKTGGAPMAIAFGPGWTVTDATPDTTTDDTLAAIDDELDGETTSWYGVTVCDSTSKATALLVAAYVESQIKIAVLQSPDTACGDSGSSTDVMSALQAQSYTRTGCFFHAYSGGTEWMAAGILGGRLAVDPGVETWAFRPIAGVTVDKMKDAFATAIEDKNGNYYVTSHSQNITWEGKAASGRFLDTTRFVDWQLSTIDFDAFTELATPPKEPFTQKGLSNLGLTIKASILKGVRVGGVDGDAPITVTVPALSDISPSDIAARVVPASSPYTFAFRLTGALHGATIRGTAGFAATA